MNAYLTMKDRCSCCGCGMCATICPKKCIEMLYDTEGFVYPSINNDLCVKCRKCSEICPFERRPYLPDRCDSKVFGAYTKNREYMMSSSSGGIFSELAKYFIINGGVVCGVTIDERHQVFHIVIDSVDDICLLQGSKYVQSDLYRCLPAIEKYLFSGRKLLFTGTPCQVAAVKNAFACENLYTADVLCHGVPSQKLFNEYILYLEEKHRGRLTEIAFRDKKRNGWSITQRYKIERNGKEKTYYLERHTSEYFSGFLRNMTQREACYKCPYTTIERVGDVTLADFWGVDKVCPEILNTDGTSLVLTSSEKGEKILAKILPAIKIVQVTIEDATYQNINFKFPPERNQKRDIIYENIFTEGYKKIGRKYMLPADHYKFMIAQILGINPMRIGFNRGRKK